MASILAKARAIASRLWRAAGEDPDTAIVGAPPDLGAGEAGMLNADLMSMSVQQYRVSKDRAERHAIRTRMDNEDGVISKALDVTVDTAFAPEEDADDADENFELKSDGTPEGDVLLEEAERLCEQIHLQQETWGTARQVLQFGNRMCEIVLDFSGTRVVRLKSLPEEQLYIRHDQFGNPQDPPWEQRSYYQQDGAGIGFAEWQIVHYTHRLDNVGLYGRGILDCERDWMRLQALEDGMVQIRLHRAGDKLIHYIPVDKAKGAAEVKAQVDSYRESLRKKRTLSALNGTQRRDSPSSVTDDYFIPVPYGETLSKVGVEPYVAQNVQIQQIRDVEYMRARVLARIGVPMRYLQIGGTEGARASLGEGGISQEDVAFARTCRKLQADVRAGHMKPITIHLMLRGMNPIDHPLRMKFPVISTSDEKRQADTENVRAQTAKIIADLVGIPPEILLDRYVKASPDEREAWLKASAEILADRAAKAAAATAALAQANQTNQQNAVPGQEPPQGAQDRRQSLRQAAEALLVVASAELGIEPLREAVERDRDGGNGRPFGPYPSLREYNPNHDRSGKFASGGGGAATAVRATVKGGYAANGMTVTSIGKLGEKAAQKMGLKPFAKAEQTYTRPCDFRLDGTHAVEVKTFSSANKDPKVRMVPAAHARKVAFAKSHGLKEMTVAVHLAANLKSATVYKKEGFGNYRIASMEKVGVVSL